MSKENDVTVVRIKTPQLKHPSRLMRAINEIRLSGIAWHAARRHFETHPCDLIAYYSPTIFWSGLVEKLKALNGCGSYLILRDIFPQWALDAGLLTRYGPAYWFFRRQELRLYRTADVIGVQSPADLDYFSKSPLQGQHKVKVLFNWAKTEDQPTASGIRLKLGLQDKVIFMYGGRLGVAQDIDNIVRLASNLSGEKNIFFLLVGDGSETARIRSHIEQHRMANIRVHPTVPQSEYFGILAECDVGLISLSRELKTQNFTGKILSYMAMGKPILASVNPGNDLRSIICGHDAGFVCDNGEDEILRQFALRLAQAADLRKRMGTNAHKLLAERFHVSAAARQILAHFSQPNLKPH